jgi:hypothetical protein
MRREPAHHWPATLRAPKARLIPAWGEAPGIIASQARGLKARLIDLRNGLPASGDSRHLFAQTYRPTDTARHSTSIALAHPSIPNIPLIELHPILPQQRPKLLLEIPLGMMHLLRFDVSNQGLQIRRSHRKRRIPPLPRKLQQPTIVLQPMRRQALQLPHQLCHGNLTRHSDRKMHMVRHAAYPITFTPQLPRYSSQISVKPHAHVLSDHWYPVLRTEDHVNQNKRERLRHGRDYRSLPPCPPISPPTSSPDRLAARLANPRQPSAKGATHTSLGRSPRYTRAKHQRAESPTHSFRYQPPGPRTPSNPHQEA